MKPYSVLTFGSCSVNIIFQPNARTGNVTSVLGAQAGTRPPFVLSLAEAVQAMRFLRGERDVPRPLRWLCGLDPDTDPVRTREALEATDFIFLEPCGAIQVKFRGFELTRFLVGKEVLDPLQDRHPEAFRATKIWYNQGIMQCNQEAMDGVADFLASLVRDDDEEAELRRSVIREARPWRAEAPAILKQMRDFVSLATGPTGVITYTHQYMPDGRSTEWPPGFVNSVIAAAKACGLSYLEPSKLVQEHGVAFAMKADRVHYSPGFEPVISRALEDFMLSVIHPGKRLEQPVAAPMAG